MRTRHQKVETSTMTDIEIAEVANATPVMWKVETSEWIPAWPGWRVVYHYDETGLVWVVEMEQL